jgi:hypothetical protein
MEATLNRDDIEVHVERKIIWNVVLSDRWEGGINHREWPHDTEKEAIERADSLFRKRLASIRGKDKL